jgi:hypothetical protein
MSKERPEYSPSAKEDGHPFDTSIFVYETSRNSHDGPSNRASFSQHHPQPGEEGPPLLQQQEEQRTKRKREMNVIHSRRKRERQKIEVKVLRERCSELSAKNLFIFHNNKSLEGLLTRANNLVSQASAEGNNDNNASVSSCNDAHLPGDISPAEATASASVTPTSSSFQEVRRLPSSLSPSSSIHTEAAAGGGLLPTGPAIAHMSVPMLPSVSNRAADGRTASLNHLMQQQQHRQQQQRQEQQQQLQQHQLLGTGNNHDNLQTSCTLQRQQQQLHYQQQHQQLQQHQQQHQQQQQQGDHQVQLAMLRRAAAPSKVPGSDLPATESMINTTKTPSTRTAGGGSLFGGATGRLAGNMSDLPTLLQLQILRQQQQQQQQLAGSGE